MGICSTRERELWAQFDALQLGSGWDEQDICKPQILVEDVFGDSHPGSVHLNQLSEHICRGVYEKGGVPGRFHTTDLCDGCAQGRQGLGSATSGKQSSRKRPLGRFRVAVAPSLADAAHRVAVKVGQGWRGGGEAGRCRQGHESGQ